MKGLPRGALPPLLIVVVLMLSTAGEALPAPNVILISWDGVQQAHLYDLMDRGELPHLSSLLAEGGIADITIHDHVTDTKAGHTQMLTGYPPRITGVYNNRRFRPIPRGYTVFERLETYSSGSIVTIMLTGKTHHVGGEKGEPFFKSKRGMDVFDSNAAHADVVGPKALQYIEEYEGEQVFAFFHFSDPDSAGHTQGENSQQYEDAIVTCDAWLGNIVDALKERGIYGKTIIYVTSDHGFDEGRTTHQHAPYVFIASNREVRSGDQKDIVPTILYDFGVDFSVIRPKLPGSPLVGSSGISLLGLSFSLSSISFGCEENQRTFPLPLCWLRSPPAHCGKLKDLSIVPFMQPLRL